MGHDLAPFDFFLWAWLRKQIQSTKPTTLEELDGRIREVVSAIPQGFLVKSVDTFLSRQSSVGLRSWWRMLASISNFR